MESKQRRAICKSGIIFLLTVFTFNTASGVLDCVTWEDLAEHLSSKEIELVDFNLCDSPDNMGDAEPDRIVSQVIENTHYLWVEYDIVANTELYTCIVMQRPNPGPLSAQDARVLLTGSMLWKSLESIADPNMSDSNDDPDTDEPIIPVGEEPVVVGIDSRTRIFRTRQYPWNTHCLLDITFPPDKVEKPDVRGTGCLISPYVILTCAHNIYDFENNLYFQNMVAVPGLRQDSEGATPQLPYGMHDIVGYQIAPGYSNSNSIEDDYGVVFVDKPFPGINTFMPLLFHSSLTKGDTVHIAGYPPKVKLGTAEAEGSSLALWDAFGPIRSVSKDKIGYTADTSGGNSGAPIRIEESYLDPYRIIGIHNTGTRSSLTGEGLYNSGARLGGHNQALITRWKEWTPPVLSKGFPYTFSFESGLEKWINVTVSDDVDWRRHSGSTSSDNTGPTSAADGTYYLYVESSDSGDDYKGHPNKVAILESPYFNIEPARINGIPQHQLDSHFGISFRYHMYGAKTGELALEISTDRGRTWSELWSLSGDQGSHWQDVSLNSPAFDYYPLDYYLGKVIKLRFKCETGSNFTSDIATDSVSISVWSGVSNLIVEPDPLGPVGEG